MTWYTDTDKTTLDYSKPIIAKSTAGNLLLLPMYHPNQGISKFCGYKWFNITTGNWASDGNTQTAGEAVKRYEELYEISNYEFEV